MLHSVYGQTRTNLIANQMYEISNNGSSGTTTYDQDFTCMFVKIVSLYRLQGWCWTRLENGKERERETRESHKSLLHCCAY